MLAVKRYKNKNKKSALKINQNKANQDDFAHLDKKLEKKDEFVRMCVRVCSKFI